MLTQRAGPGSGDFTMMSQRVEERCEIASAWWDVRKQGLTSVQHFPGGSS